MTTGEVIQTCRARRNLSQERLAELVGVSRQAVSKWEVGDALPDTDKLVPLARALGITVGELLGNGPAAPPPEEGQPTSAPEGRRPGWFELHWYWLGLIPVIWGCWALIQLLPVLLFALGVTNSLTSAVYSF